MTERVKKLYKAGLKNERFLRDIKAADGDEAPTMFSSRGVKLLFTSVYYGWLVSEYGKRWEEFM
jgi:hypothetical protein